MEFKGSKGWRIKRYKRNFPSCTHDQIVDENDNSIFEIQLAQSDEVMNANTLIAVKAPEMLEVLKESIKTIEWYLLNAKAEDNDRTTFFNLGNNQVNEIEKLIKEATEL